MKKTFAIKFISPLLIGGVTRDKQDSIGLTGKALRGCWRFWFRAVLGGFLSDIHNDELKDLILMLEEEIFGSTRISKFRLLVEPICMQIKEGIIRLPHRTGKKNAPKEDAPREGVDAGATFMITLLQRPGMTSQEMDILTAVIWIWANLGAIGNRARRGFGSPVLCMSDKNTKMFKDFQRIGESFGSKDKLKENLQNGIEQVWKTFYKWLLSDKVKVKLESYLEAHQDSKIKNLLQSWIEGNVPFSENISKNKQTDAEFFILKSLRQVAIGEKGYRSLYHACDSTCGGCGAIKALHGRKNCLELGWASHPQGSKIKRWASPVFLRLHIIKKGPGEEEFFPIMTWCKQKKIPSSTPSCAVKYLKEDIGFINSITGDPI